MRLRRIDTFLRFLVYATFVGVIIGVWWRGDTYLAIAFFVLLVHEFDIDGLKDWHISQLRLRRR